jgi:hypothetical protein
LTTRGDARGLLLTVSPLTFHSRTVPQGHISKAHRCPVTTLIAITPMLTCQSLHVLPHPALPFLFQYPIFGLDRHREPIDRMYRQVLDRPAFLYHIESQEVVSHFLGRPVTLTQQGI